MAKLTDEQVAENMAIVQKMVAGWTGPRRAQVAKMLSGPIGEEFFTAPASSREDYHGCYPGGLAEHSLHVVEQVKQFRKIMALNVSDQQAEFLGLVHDLGKVGDDGVPLYVPNPSDWHRKKGMLYETNRDLIYMPTCDRTIYLLQKYGITLENDEFVAIRISDGPYEKSNEKYNMKEPNLALLLHFADRWATASEKLST